MKQESVLQALLIIELSNQTFTKFFLSGLKVCDSELSLTQYKLCPIVPNNLAHGVTNKVDDEISRLTQTDRFLKRSIGGNYEKLVFNIFFFSFLSVGNKKYRFLSQNTK